MLMVMKRSGNMEAFDGVKIQNAIASASDEIRRPMNKSDVSFITDTVCRGFQDRESVTSEEIHTAVMKTLIAQGYNEVARAYGGFKE